MSLRRLARFWFRDSDPVAPSTYFRHGAGLMAFKYAVDAGVVWAVFDVTWTPWQYLSPFFLDRQELLQGPSFLIWAFVAWTIPFLWVGVLLTMRRALDAGASPWLSLLFFVPFLNYVTMLALSVVPTSAVGASKESRDTAGPARSALVGVAVGTLLIVGMVLRVDLLGGYGSTLFLGAPFVIGAVTGYLYNERGLKTMKQTAGLVLVSLAMGAGVVLLLALEGVLCVLMAAPLAAPVGLMGGALGRAMARPASPLHPTTAALVVLPLLALPSVPVERATTLREVITAVEIDAPPSVVWDHVIGFSEIEAPPDLLSRLGVAYPLRARIEGEGVGAVRYCEFSTGAFVEPITVWEPGRRLGFDVRAQPEPLEEWSPYRNVHPPHLDGYFRSKRGEFRLVELPDGGTRLEGSTFYEIDLHPQLYWHRWSDALIHSIHRRVLDHVRRSAEADARG